MNNIVEFKNVYKKYGNTDALKGIDIKIPKGKIVGLLGPNGSGKTTMIKIMNGFTYYNWGRSSYKWNETRYRN